MSLDPELLKQLLTTFEGELDDEAQLITDGLLKLEKETSPEVNQKTIETIFRAAHNIKGASRGLGIQNVGEISHRIETLFTKIKNHSIIINKNIIDMCLEAVDKMYSAFASFTEQTPLDFDLEELLSRMDKGENNTAATTQQIEYRDQKENLSEQCDFPLQKHYSETSPPRKDNDIHPHEAIKVPISKIDKVFALLEEVQINKIANELHYTELCQINNKYKEFSKVWQQVMYSLKSGQDINDNYRKLYLSLNDYFSEINYSTSQLQKSMKTQLNELSILSNTLQEEVRLLRLVPAESLLRTLPRYARDLAYELKKEVELEIHGDNVRMDKMVLDGLKDPLIHIIRNAIDHGIESPDIRKALNKPITGRIRLDVIDEGNRIYIKISDDGCGIDLNKITKYIEDIKLATAVEIAKMSEDEILGFIFRSGFTTRKMITAVSGRGVGLDVVKTNLTELKGNASVTTRQGKETTFILSVPLTLSTERGLLVSSGEELFVVPTHTVKRVLVVQPDDIIDVEGNQALLIDEHPVILRVLSDVLKLNGHELNETDQLSVIVIEKGWDKVALVVDTIIGEREIVIKPLRPPLSTVDCVSGGTLLEHNHVAVVLNTKDLLRSALNTTSIRRVSAHEDSKAEKIRTHILVVDDSITTRTLEKNILESKNYQVTVSVNGSEAWELIQKNRFSLIITDISMPVMDGFTLTEKIKKSEQFRDIPVIIVTSLDSESEKARGIEAGADAYIVKSEFESGTLLDIITQLV